MALDIEEKRRRRRRWRRNLALTNLAGLALAYLLGEYVGERTWPTTLIAYCPPVLFALPTLPLLLIALICRDKVALRLNLIGAVFALTVVMGLHLPIATIMTAKGQRLRVMTYNIQHGIAGAEKIAKTIHDQNPDVVCLQEVNGYGVPDPLPALTAALPEYKIMRFAESAVATRLPIRDVRAYPLVSTSFRMATEVEVEYEGKPVTVVSVHLATAARPENIRGSWRTLPRYLRHTTEIRAAQVDKLIAVTADIKHPLIVCGDFNTPPRGRLYSALTGVWEDAFAETGIGYGYSYSDRKPVLRIDYIFTGNGAKARYASVPTVHTSDHFPLVAEVRIP